MLHRVIVLTKYPLVHRRMANAPLPYSHWQILHRFDSWG
jgi:hypothetical protein